MNNLTKQLMAISVDNTKKIHHALDMFIEKGVDIFPSNEFTFDQKNIGVVTTVDDFKIIIQRDLNNFTVVITVTAKDGETVVARCVAGVGDIFEETYTKGISKTLKTKLAEWFADIADVSIDNISIIESDCEETSERIDAEVVDTADIITD